MRKVRRTTATAVLLCGAAALLPIASASAADDGDTLAPALQELAKPSVRALPSAEQAQLLGVAAAGPGSLLREDGRVLVEARFDSGAIARLPAVEAAGGEVLASSREYQLATVSVPYADLRELGEVPGLAAVTPVRAPVLRAPEPGCQGGSVISEGIAQLNVEAARAKLGTESEPSKEGEGLTVGVLSDSLAQATKAVGGGEIATVLAADVAAKELPGETNSCPGQSDRVRELRLYEPVKANQPPTDEGRAMSQIVHDVVPKAKLAFHSAFNGEQDFAEGIEELAAPIVDGGAEANVIVDDVGYFNEPFFQDGPVAAAINKVVAEGVTYLTSAGNDNLLDADGNQIASWETPAYRDSGNCPALVRALAGFKATHCLDFDPGAPVDRTFGIKVKAGETLTIDLQWAEPWEDVDTDLDVFLLDAEGRLLSNPFANSNNLGLQRPVEILQWENTGSVEKTVQLVVNRYVGPSPRVKFILLQNGGKLNATEYPKSGGGDVVGPAVYGHAGAAAAITTGAVPYNNSNQVERYSSRGPVTHYFEPVGSGPALPLGSPEVISKPDLAATDCGRTTFFSFQTEKEPPVWRFCGTSAAAPHAAGVAALALEAGATDPDAVRAALAGTARMVGTFGSCAAGAGLIDALVAVEAVGGGPTTPPPTCSPPNSSDPVERAAGEWGLEQPPEKPEEPETPPVIEKEPEKPIVEPPKPETKPPTTEPPVQPKTIPTTVISTHPRKLVRTSRAAARVVFRFAAEPSDSTFRCQFDGSRWRVCKATVSRWFGLGPHVVRVQARSKDGGLDASPAVFRFRVARSR